MIRLNPKEYQGKGTGIFISQSNFWVKIPVPVMESCIINDTLMRMFMIQLCDSK